ncbi:MAG: translation initiation factor IF-2 subunit gamma, partial [Candidatus Paceibacteria bacterium]
MAIATTLDPSMTKADALVGNVITPQGKGPLPLFTLEIEPYFFEYVVGIREKIRLEPFKQFEPLMVNIGTATTLGVIQSGGKVLKLALRRPVVAKKGDHVALARQVQGRWHL